MHLQSYADINLMLGKYYLDKHKKRVDKFLISTSNCALIQYRVVKNR